MSEFTFEKPPRIQLARFAYAYVDQIIKHCQPDLGDLPNIDKLKTDAYVGFSTPTRTPKAPFIPAKILGSDAVGLSGLYRNQNAVELFTELEQDSSGFMCDKDTELAEKFGCDLVPEHTIIIFRDDMSPVIVNDALFNSGTREEVEAYSVKDPRQSWSLLRLAWMRQNGLGEAIHSLTDMECLEIVKLLAGARQFVAVQEIKEFLLDSYK